MDDIKLEVVVDSVWMKIVARPMGFEVARISTENFPSQEQAEEFARTLAMRFNSIEAVTSCFVDMRNALAAAQTVTKTAEARISRDPSFWQSNVGLHEVLKGTTREIAALLEKIDLMIGA